MLGFFRRFQKFFFIIVTFFIAISFLFFGINNAMMDKQEVVDKKIGELVDGSPLMERRLQGLIAMLEHGVEEGTRTPNLLSGSIVHKRFILSGLGRILAHHVFDDIKDELKERFQRASLYTPYQHPYTPHISAQQIWIQNCPQILSLLSRIQSHEGNFTREQVDLLFDCYCAQASFPAPLLHQMLDYYERQSHGVRPDPGLKGANLALFGFESVKDWFGARFIDQMSRFIFNASLFAKEQGYGVSIEEARKDLYRNVSRAIEHLQGGQQADIEQIHAVYMNQIQRLGLSEGEAVLIWQDVLSFERMVEETGQGVFFDSLFPDQFKRFAAKGATVIHYEMPEPLRFNTFYDLLRFERYKEIVSECGLLDLPQSMRDSQDLLEEHPDLVYKRFDVELSSVTKDEVAARVSLKKTWEWEGDAENYAHLVNEFSVLEGKSAATFEERMESLDQIDPSIRLKIDQYARLSLVAAHPEWIEEELFNCSASCHTLEVRLKQDGHPFSGSDFLALIEGDSPELKCYSPDGITYFSISTLEKYPGWNIVAFEDANDVLEEKLDHILRVAYDNSGESSPYDQVRDRIAASVYRDLICAIGGDAEDLDQLATRRFDAYLRQMYSLAIESSDAFALALEKPFSVVGSTKQWFVENVDIGEGEYAKVENGSFFQLVSHKQVHATEAEIAKAKEYLSLEAQKKLMKFLIEKL
jgi:hypothetical protein